MTERTPTHEKTVKQLWNSEMCCDILQPLSSLRQSAACSQKTTANVNRDTGWSEKIWWRASYL